MALVSSAFCFAAIAVLFSKLWVLGATLGVLWITSLVAANVLARRADRDEQIARMNRVTRGMEGWGADTPT